MTRDNEHLLVQEGDPTKLWIVFSHVNVPAAKFAQTHVFRRMPGKKVFLNTGKNDWYQAGLPGVADSFSGLVGWIQKLISESDAKDVTLVGHSMGAYVALAAGSVLDGVSIVATSPEFDLCIEGSRSQANGVVPELGWERIQASTRVDGVVPGVVALGAFDPIDAYFLSRAMYYQGCGFRLVEVPYHHGVTEFLTATGVYLELLSRHSGDLAGFEARGVLSRPGHWGASEQYLHFYKTYIQNKRAGEAANTAVSHHKDWVNPGWQGLRSSILLAGGDHLGAVAAGEMAFEVAPSIIQFAEGFVKACIAANETRRLANLADYVKAHWSGSVVGDRILNQIRDKLPTYPIRSRGEAAIAERPACRVFAERNFRSVRADHTGELAPVEVDMLTAKNNNQDPPAMLLRLASIMEENNQLLESACMAREAFLLDQSPHIASEFVRIAVHARRFDDVELFLDRIDVAGPEFKGAVSRLARLPTVTTNLNLAYRCVEALAAQGLLDDDIRSNVLSHLRRFTQDEAEIEKFEVALRIVAVEP